MLFTAGKAVSVPALVLEIKRVALEIKLSFVRATTSIQFTVSQLICILFNLNTTLFIVSVVKTKFVITSESVNLYYTTIDIHSAHNLLSL